MESKEGFEQPSEERSDEVFDPKPKRGRARLQRLLRGSLMGAILASGIGDAAPRKAQPPGENARQEQTEGSVERIPKTPENLEALLKTVLGLSYHHQMAQDHIRALRELNIPVEWRNDEILFFPRDILLDRTTGRNEPISPEQIKSIEQELQQQQVTLPENFFTTRNGYTDQTYREQQRTVTALARIAPELRPYAETGITSPPASFSASRYIAQLDTIPKDGRIAAPGDFLLTIYDQQTGKTYVDLEPVRNIKTLSPAVAAQRMGERIDRFREFLADEGRGASASAAQDTYFEHDLSGREDEAAAGERPLYAIDVLDPLSEEEKEILRSPEAEKMNIRFDFSPDGVFNSFASASFDLFELAEIGKRLRLRMVERYDVNDRNRPDKGRSVRIYPDIFEEYERTGTMGLMITAEAGTGKRVRVGEVDVGNFEHRILGPYHYYDLKFEGQPAVSAAYDMERLTQGVSRTEAWFGGKPGDFVRRIIADSWSPGSGGSYRTTEDTLAIFADRRMISKGHHNDIGSLARHEASHLIDDWFNITENFAERLDPSPERDRDLVHARAYADAYTDMPIAFLEALAEGDLDILNPEINPDAGHPGDGIEEFFASVIVSLDIKDPGRVFAQKDAEFLGYYRRALGITVERLRTISALAHAPVVRELQARIALIESLPAYRADIPANK